jgi:hypothetical protein
MGAWMDGFVARVRRWMDSWMNGELSEMNGKKSKKVFHGSG